MLISYFSLLRVLKMQDKLFLYQNLALFCYYGIICTLKYVFISF